MQTARFTPHPHGRGNNHPVNTHPCRSCRPTRDGPTCRGAWTAASPAPQGASRQPLSYRGHFSSQGCQHAGFCSTKNSCDKRGLPLTLFTALASLYCMCFMGTRKRAYEQSNQPSSSEKTDCCTQFRHAHLMSLVYCLSVQPWFRRTRHDADHCPSGAAGSHPGPVLLPSLLSSNMPTTLSLLVSCTFTVRKKMGLPVNGLPVNVGDNSNC